MSKIQRHHTEFRGEQEASVLLCMIHLMEENKDPNRFELGNVLDAIRHIQRAEELTTHTRTTPESRELKKLIGPDGPINEILRMCLVRPAIDNWQPGKLHFEFTPNLGPGSAKPGCYSRRGMALWNLVNLSQMGLARRIRRCAYAKCGKWFFARFHHQTHCPGGDCRIRDISGSEKWRTYRREKSKKYYWLRKDKNVL